MKMNKTLKTALNIVCAAIILSVIVLSVILAARTGASVGGIDVSTGSYFSKLLKTLCAGFPNAACAIAVYFFYNGIFVACRATIKKLVGTKDFTPLLISVAVITAVFFPFRSCITNFSAAIQFAFPIALALFATAFMIFFITENKHYIPSVILYVLACGGHPYVAVAVSVLLAVINIIELIKKKSVKKTAVAFVIALICTVINCVI